VIIHSSGINIISLRAMYLTNPTHLSFKFADSNCDGAFDNRLKSMGGRSPAQMLSIYNLFFV